MAQSPEQLTLVIFGASGDLMGRKLAPSLFRIFCDGQLPGDTSIIGMSRTEYSNDSFRNYLKSELPPEYASNAERWPEFAGKVSYFPGQSSDVDALAELDAMVAEKTNGGPDNRIYYLALAPTLVSGTLQALGQAGMLSQRDGFRRVVVEKPFGTDIASARELNSVVHSVLDESQVFRIDHYLGKDTVQNLLVFRFANTIFEPIWNRNYIDHVQISVLESIGLEGRGEYYDGAGVLKDMFQSHLMQLLALVAMEPPVSSDADALRDEKAKVLRAVRRFDQREAANHSVRGQYNGYRSEPRVAESSGTATYGALRLFVDNWRWQGVPFYLRSGKAMHKKISEISIQFSPPPHTIFESFGGSVLTPNALQIRLQPDEGVHLVFESKAPGTRMGTQPQDLSFHFPESGIREAYERLLIDLIEGDQSLFTRSDEIEQAWEIVDPFVEAWKRSLASQLFEYEQGSWGPEAADAFLGEDRHWLADRLPRGR